MSIQHAIYILKKELKATRKIKEIFEFRHGYFYREEDIKALEKGIKILDKGDKK